MKTCLSGSPAFRGHLLSNLFVSYSSCSLWIRNSPLETRFVFVQFLHKNENGLAKETLWLITMLYPKLFNDRFVHCYSLTAKCYQTTTVLPVHSEFSNKQWIEQSAVQCSLWSSWVGGGQIPLFTRKFHKKLNFAELFLGIFIWATSTTTDVHKVIWSPKNPGQRLQIWRSE